MASEKAPVTTPSIPVGSTDPMAAARAARVANRKKRPTLNEKQAFVANAARGAMRAAKLIVRRVENGDEIDASCVQACTTLSGAVGSLLLSD